MRRRPEWLHEGVLFEEEETAEERNQRASREALFRSFEQVPGLAELYSVDPETGSPSLDPAMCERKGESAVQQVLKEVMAARLEGSTDREIVFQGPKARIGMHLSAEHMHETAEGAPALMMGIVYTDPSFRSRDGVEVISRQAILLDPDGGRFLSREVSRPWSDPAGGRGDFAPRDDLEYRSAESGLTEVMVAISLLAEGRKIEPKPQP